MKWCLFALAVLSIVLVASGLHFSLLATGITALVVLIFEIYFKNQELLKVKASIEKVEEAFAILQKNQLTLTTLNKRLEDKIEAMAQGLPVSTRMRQK